MLDVGVLQAIVSNEMEDADMATDNNLMEPKTMLPTEDSLVPAAVLPRLQDSVPQTCPQEESCYKKAHCRDDAPTVLGYWAPPRASPTGCRRNTDRLQTGTVIGQRLIVLPLPF
jgi:hypothetical protein